MLKPIFNNKPNTFYELSDGKIVWESRSCAVMAIVIAIYNGETYIALGKRGKGTPDEQGKFGLVCGYMDWNENAFDAARREIWEELGLDVSNELDWSYETQPWYVQSEPTANRQNITMRFWFRTHCKDLPLLTSINAEENEIEELRWIPLNEAINMNLAFNHQHALKDFFNKLNSVRDTALWEKYDS